MRKAPRRFLCRHASVALLILTFPLAADKWFGADKMKHFFMSAFIQSMAYSSARAAGASHDGAFVSATAATVGFGIGREIYDGRVKRAFSYKDLVWDGAGLAAGMALVNKAQR
jgi:putative lipoprotein